MFEPASRREIFVFHERVSFHKQIDGLAAIVRQRMGVDPMSGAYFVFRSRSRHSVRILFFNGDGFELLTRRLSRGCFEHWPEGGIFSSLLVKELTSIIWGDYCLEI